MVPLSCPQQCGTQRHVRISSPHNGTSHIARCNSESPKPSGGAPELTQPHFDADRTSGHQTGNFAGLYCLRTTSRGGSRTHCAWRALPSRPTPTQGGRRSRHGCRSVYVPHGPCSGVGGNLLWVEREGRGSTTGSGRQSGVSPRMEAADYVTVRHHNIVVKTTYGAHPRLAKTVIENAWGQLSALIYCVDCCAIGGRVRARLHGSLPLLSD